MVTLDDPRLRAEFEGPPEPLRRMSFGEHLDELRKRLIRSLLAIVIACFALLPFHDQVLEIIVKPYRILWQQAFNDHVVKLEQMEQDGQVDEYEVAWLAFCRKEGTKIRAGTFRHAQQLQTYSGFPIPYTLQAIGGLADFWTFMMASLLFALALASPVVIWQMWAFIAAGLYVKERAVFYRYFPFMVVLLLSGVLFGYFMAVPYGLGFLIRMMKPDQVTSMLTVDQYFTMLFAMTTALGVVFQLPLVMVALQRVGLVRHRTMRKHWRIIVLAIFILAAVFTPPDPFSMMAMAIPMLFLYVLGLLLTWFAQKREAPDPGAASPPA
ncbi:MAG TPA: twin-arginine translocase subunit TatC [Planctomycetota bacterium]|nr:twin-arginine translocase subunit TatC [Planctomycetota bacterium]